MNSVYKFLVKHTWEIWAPMCTVKRQTSRLRFIIGPKQWYGRTRVTTCGCGVFWRQLELHWRCLIGERGRPWPWVWTMAVLASAAAIELWTSKTLRMSSLVILGPPTGRVKWADRQHENLPGSAHDFTRKSLFFAFTLKSLVWQLLSKFFFLNECENWNFKKIEIEISLNFTWNFFYFKNKSLD